MIDIQKVVSFGFLDWQSLEMKFEVISNYERTNSTSSKPKTSKLADIRYHRTSSQGKKI